MKNPRKKLYPTAIEIAVVDIIEKFISYRNQAESKLEEAKNTFEKFIKLKL